MRSLEPKTDPSIVEIRLADIQQVERMQELIRRAARQLSTGFYNARQIESAIQHVFGVDTALIRDGCYFEAFVDSKLAGCGGWSQRHSLYGGDQGRAGSLDRLNPATEAARLRAFFIDPKRARQGVGSALYRHARDEALKAGFQRLELVATLPGVPFYRHLGFEAVEKLEHRLPDGLSLPCVKMQRSIAHG